MQRRSRSEELEMTWTKRILLFLVVAFFVFYLVVHPVSAAGAVKTVFNGVETVFNGVVRFFSSLAR
jgi:hypothetical protein